MDGQSDSTQIQSNAATLKALLSEPAPTPIPGQPIPEVAEAAPASPEGAPAGGREGAGSDTDDPSAPKPPAEPPAEPTDEEVFGSPELAWESDDPVDEAQPSDQSFEPSGLTSDDITEVKAILGDGSKELTRDQINRLQMTLFNRSRRGQRYNTAFKVVRSVEQALNREISDPNEILSRLRDADTLDEMVQTMRTGPQGARQVLEELMRSGDGREYPWAQHVRAAAREILGSDIESTRQQAAQSEYERLVDTAAQRAATNFRNDDKDAGQWWLDLANKLYYVNNGEAHPNRAEIRQGRYEPKAAQLNGNGGPNGAAPQNSPAEQPSSDPEKEALRQQLAQHRNMVFRQSLDGWARAADGIVMTAAEEALKPLKTLVSQGVINDRVYDAERQAYFGQLYDALGPAVADIGRKAYAALQRGDSRQLDFLKREMQGQVGKAMAATRIQFLSPYKDKVLAASARTKQTQTRQAAAGEKTEASGVGPAAPAAVAKGPTGDRDGNLNYLKSLMR